MPYFFDDLTHKKYIKQIYIGDPTCITNIMYQAPDALIITSNVEIDWHIFMPFLPFFHWKDVAKIK